jgi:Fe-Mn family superoxide dismutase
MEFIQIASPGQHKLFPLPYGFDTLEPVISTETLHLHHDIIQQKYIDGLNNAEIHLEEVRKSGDYALIQHWEDQMAYHGSGMILHCVYWTTMAPAGQGGRPGTETEIQINKNFENYARFQEQFINTAKKLEGPGWIILSWQPFWHRPEILRAELNENKAIWSGIPILALDLWEHAYFLDYKISVNEYIDKWWQLINWKEVEARLVLAMNGEVTLSI